MDVDVDSDMDSSSLTDLESTLKNPTCCSRNKYTADELAALGSSSKDASVIKPEKVVFNVQGGSKIAQNSNKDLRIFPVKDIILNHSECNQGKFNSKLHVIDASNM